MPWNAEKQIHWSLKLVLLDRNLALNSDAAKIADIY